jgi:hypothetical protein
MRIYRVSLIMAPVALGSMLLACAGRLPPPPGGGGGTISSTDGKCQIQTPIGWSSRTDLHGTASLQAANSRADAYIIVLSEAKIDFAPNYTYRDYNNLTLTNFLKNVQDAKVVRGPKDVTINGRAGIQQEIQGIVKNIQIVYLRTVVDGKDSFHQVLTWTIRSKADTNRSLMEQLTNSFQETPTTTPK